MSESILWPELSGINLIEAAAGTGKTYTIESLFLRLILEKDLRVDQILVITYTVAATEELRDRVRSRLSQALHMFIQNSPPEDTLLKKLFAEHQENREKTIQKLTSAVHNFDLAAIYTIHGFCQRVLADFSFVSNALFQAEIITDEDPLIQEIVYDFWRQNILGLSPVYLHFLQNPGKGLKPITPHSLCALAKQSLNHPNLKIVPDEPAPDLESVEQEYVQAFSELKRLWDEREDKIRDLFLNTKALPKNIYRPDKLTDYLDKLSAFLHKKWPDAQLPDKFHLFTTSHLTAKTKKNHEPPQDILFDSCERLKDINEKLIKNYTLARRSLKEKFLRFVFQELESRKAKKNVLGFGDLLTHVHAALSGPAGLRLTSCLRQKYRAVLIDEFQDTDPLQYAIFSTLFNCPGYILFLIGDPKQAIYSFRGADVFAYLKAREKCTHTYTLDTNWRSEPGLVQAINTVFKRHKNPFADARIKYTEVKPAPKKQEKFTEEKYNANLVVYLASPKDLNQTKEELAASNLEPVLARHTACEILRLLLAGQKNKALIGQKPVQPEDIAVLVRTHHQAQTVLEELKRLHIPCVIYNTGNIFTTDEAREIYLLLRAISNWTNDNYILTALATPFLGLTSADLKKLEQDNEQWEAWVQKFYTLHQKWQTKGIIAALNHLMLSETTRQRVLSLSLGERKLTNYMQLIELLHQYERENSVRMAGLLMWLRNMMQNNSGSDREEHPLRLESDRQAVKIITIHKSKGLEFPIVFCPFLHAGSRIKDEQIFYHGDDGHLVLDLGSKELKTKKIVAEKEILGENLRLMYVALTRARHRCYLTWGKVKDADTSAPAYIFHLPQADDSHSILSQAEERFKKLNFEDIKKDLEELAHASEGCIEISSLGESELAPRCRYSGFEDEDEELSALNFTRHLDKTWSITSFTSLTKSIYVQKTEFDEPFYPGFLPQVATPDEKNIFTLEPGPKTGNLLHELLEQLDFKHPKDIEDVIPGQLDKFGFAREWEKVIRDLMQRVATLQLKPGLNLKDVGLNERIAEMEFYLPLKGLEAETLQQLYQQWAFSFPHDFFQSVKDLDFQTTHGFLKGYIDLVFTHENKFYLLDWKSNYLGAELEDYAPKNLARVIKEHYYFLQYHLYTVALIKHLKSRMPGFTYDQFGGIFYVFLRGINESSPGYGVFFDRPEEQFIAALSEFFQVSRS